MIQKRLYLLSPIRIFIVVLLCFSFSACKSEGVNPPVGGGGGGSGDGGEKATYIVTVESRDFSQEGPSYNWFRGYTSNHMYYWASTSTGTPYNAARWNVPFSEPGRYQVSVYIPPTSGMTNNAVYTLWANEQNYTIIINQSQYQDVWVPLGIYYFHAEGGEYVELTNTTSIRGFKIVFDAVMWEEEELEGEIR